MKFSNDASLNAQIIAHRRKMADRIEHAGPAISATAIKGKALPGMSVAGLSPVATAGVVSWLRGVAAMPTREGAR